MFCFFSTDHVFPYLFHIIFRSFSLVSTMTVDGMIIQLASKNSSVCCYQAEVSKYEFSNSRKVAGSRQKGVWELPKCA